MKRVMILFMVLTMVLFSTNYAFSQEIGLATFQETAQVIVDKSISQNVSASITLQSTSIQEIKIPAELEKKIRENDKILAVIITNEEQCVLGVSNESCIMINVERPESYKDVIAIQENTKNISEEFIDDINKTFDTNAKFHSVFIHGSDETNRALETSGIVSGKGIVSATYTMPMEDTDSMYEKISSMLIPKVIRDSGGFYDVARDLSTHDNAKMTFSIIPIENKSLLQLKLSLDYPETASEINVVNPLEYLKTKELKRSKYFSSGMYPLNSIIQVVILSPEKTSISDVKGNILPTQLVEGEEIPTDVTKPGWVFDPEQGTRVQGKYIFGEAKSVEEKDLIFSLEGSQLEDPKEIKTSFDESITVVVIIVIGAIAAAIFYLKGYKR